MASIGILLILTVLSISVGDAKTFINVQCKTENRAQYGQSSLLECVVRTAQDVSNVQIRVVTWKKKGVEEPLLVFNRGRMMANSRYSFAEPSWNDKNMNVSLLIANTAVEDEGVYDCMVMTNSGDNTNHTNLNVTAKYSVPTIKPIPETITQNTDGTLVCNSDGGYPQGQLRWFDEHNMEWTKSADMEVKKTESGLFNLSSSLKLMRGSVFSKYTCIVFNASRGKEDEATFEIPDKPKSEGHEREKGLDPASKIVAPVVVIGSLIAGLLLVLVLCRRRRHQRDRREVRTCESEDEGGDHQEMDTKCQDSLA
ncbi:putative selection and upkeep of intraepithelial T-cells protein 1 homolog isoform X2 [Chaetodon auriga]|uniref:putative selection and upkeep of intraepithelial T-cells protein 1 homolog isoform X2 n=1 Tax=Chaetodon auriga TaxID=39042 RepID=UPI004032C3ED